MGCTCVYFLPFTFTFYLLPFHFLMVPAIVLAAGSSSRMGRPKALLPLGGGGETFLSRILTTLREAEVDDRLVVVGYDAAAIKASLAQLNLSAPRRARGALSLSKGVRLVENVEYERGQLSSLQAGLRAADRPGVRAVLVTLVDVPLVSAQTVRAVLDAYRRHPGAPIVRPVRGGRHGHPVVFDRALFGELRAADPAVGAKLVVRAHHDEILDVDVADEGAFLDIDTPVDYERIIASRGVISDE